MKPGAGGVLSALVSPGMRAISTKIREDTAVANLILPNDRVDIIVTRRAMVKGKEQVESSILFGNVRVLAIGQNIENSDGKTAVLSERQQPSNFRQHRPNSSRSQIRRAKFRSLCVRLQTSMLLRGRRDLPKERWERQCESDALR